MNLLARRCPCWATESYEPRKTLRNDIDARCELEQLLIEQVTEADRLRAALEEVNELAAWHCDDGADEADNSPEDMTAHVNGIIRQKCMRALTPNALVKRPPQPAGRGRSA